MAISRPSISELKETVALSNRLLFLAGLVATRGHASARIPGTDRFLMKTWPHIHMDRIQAQDLITMDLDGNIVEGKRAGTTRVSEWPIHAEIYRTHPDVGGVIHTHQKWASIVAIAGRAVLPVLGSQFASSVAEPLPVFDEDKALIRSVLQGRLVAQALGNAVACHLQNHGMVFVGPSLELATLDAIQIEYEAEITWRASLIGTPCTIPTYFMRRYLERRREGKVPEAWEHFWKWADKHPESFRPRSYQI
jgi:ribulose-5-phosphate 4-epimerase/fuculose-1-phosphate aldolase